MKLIERVAAVCLFIESKLASAGTYWEHNGSQETIYTNTEKYECEECRRVSVKGDAGIA